MQITEIFTSIQGEGWNTGIPMTFIRFAGCNIIKQCQGCDTPQARALQQGTKWDTHEVLRAVPRRVRHVCFTGGEPALQQDEWLSLTRKLWQLGHVLALETNGTIAMCEMVRQCFEWIVVSPKTSEVRTLPGITYANEVKFLLDHPNTLLDSRDTTGEELRRQCRQVGELNPAALFSVQPWLTGDPDEDRNRIARAVEFAIEQDVRLSVQLHKLLGVQ